MSSAISQSMEARELLRQIKNLRVELSHTAPEQKAAIRRRIAGLRMRWERTSRGALRSLELEMAALRQDGVHRSRAAGTSAKGLQSSSMQSP